MISTQVVIISHSCASLCLQEIHQTHSLWPCPPDTTYSVENINSKCMHVSELAAYVYTCSYLLRLLQMYSYM